MSELVPSKIGSRHLDRLAIVYVRQSHPQQQIKHPESLASQKRLRERIEQWGWPAERIHILDGDLGKSGTTTVGRDDYAWLLSEITMQHVGLVAGFQINRLAREDETICHLIKACWCFDTLLADQDGVYHPQDFNDRLVLTIKGLVGGVELYQLQQRMQHGRLERARRGEWLGVPPLGYVIGEDRKLVFDPDQQAQEVVRTLFGQFARQGSISALLRHLQKHDVRLPIRTTVDPRDPISWHQPHRETIRNLLRHPVYTGTYTWGRRPCDPKRALPGRRGTGRIVRAPADCPVFLPGNHPAFIDEEQYERNQQRLASHRRRGPQPSPVRHTVSLLAGRVFCGLCGARMQPHYAPHLRYECARRALDYGQPRCVSLPGREIESLLAAQILIALEPASLALSLSAAEKIQDERAVVDRQWQLRLERAQHDAHRAFRQYDQAEPENRLVARNLESRWEEKLSEVRKLTEDYHRFRATQPLTLSLAERRAIEQLATNLPRLWHAPSLPVSEKRRVVELLLEKAVVTHRGDERLAIALHWSGGTVTQHELKRRVRSWSCLSTYQEILQHLAAQASRGQTSDQIAAWLNEQGYRTCRDTPFTSANVRQLRQRSTLATKTPSC